MAFSASPQIIGYFKRLRMNFGACAGTMNCEPGISFAYTSYYQLSQRRFEGNLGSLFRTV
jgi:hypothetical protein